MTSENLTEDIHHMEKKHRENYFRDKYKIITGRFLWAVCQYISEDDAKTHIISFMVRDAKYGIKRSNGKYSIVVTTNFFSGDINTTHVVFFNKTYDSLREIKRKFSDLDALLDEYKTQHIPIAFKKIKSNINIPNPFLINIKYGPECSTITDIQSTITEIEDYY